MIETMRGATTPSPPDLKALSKPLRSDQIEFRVGSINKGGYANILVYKDARADMQRLDDVVGPLGWKREHTRDNKNCIVSIYNGSQWVGKEDTGSPSSAEPEKGLASDSFKRACFNWGIGRELYDYPVISIKLNGGGNKNGAEVEWFLDEEKKDKWGKPTVRAGWGLKLKEWEWTSYWEESSLWSLTANDQDGKERYHYGPTYTPSHKLTFDSMIEDKNHMLAVVIQQTWPKKMLEHLFNSFEKGKITKKKDLLRDLNAKGWEVLKESAEIIHQRGEVGPGGGPDDSVCLEIINDMTDPEKKILMGILDKDDIEYLKGLKE